MSEPNLSTCDYYQGVGICTFGCWEEPACFTDEPYEGWPKIDRHPYATFLLAARRYDRKVVNHIQWAKLRRFCLGATHA